MSDNKGLYKTYLIISPVQALRRQRPLDGNVGRGCHLRAWPLDGNGRNGQGCLSSGPQMAMCWFRPYLLYKNNVSYCFMRCATQFFDRFFLFPLVHIIHISFFQEAIYTDGYQPISNVKISGNFD